MQQSSLRFLLLRWLLPAMLVLLLAGAVTAYLVALRSATKAYDRALFDTALAIVEQLTIQDGKPVLPLTAQARDVLLVDKFDQVFFAVRGPNGELLDGEPGLPMPIESTASKDTPLKAIRSCTQLINFSVSAFSVLQSFVETLVL